MGKYDAEIAKIKAGRVLWVKNQLDQYHKVLLLTSVLFWNEFEAIIVERFGNKRNALVTDFNFSESESKLTLIHMRRTDIENIICLYRCYQFTDKLIIGDFEHIKEYRRILNFDGIRGLDRRRLVEETILRK